MDTLKPQIIPLAGAAGSEDAIIGGKAAKLARLMQAGYRVPDGFCIPIYAYRQFLRANKLDRKIAFELGRKSFENMRWEEIWDAALRIRAAFQAAALPDPIQSQLFQALEKLGPAKTLVVRSSAPKEDSAQASFAGLHESYVGVKGFDALLDAVRLVWASLWSDAALLYQHELGLAPQHSTMAVVVQELVVTDISGVAFGTDPRNPKADISIIEAVPGLCQDLVDGVTDPDRWTLKRSTGAVLETRIGKREQASSLLQALDVQQIYETLQGIEQLFGWQPDTEWTGTGKKFTLLQARPITTTDAVPKDNKAYYLTLRPGEKRLNALADRVANELIPQLEAEGEKLAAENLTEKTDADLARAIETRQQVVEKWKKIYRNDFIPFAHGVRHLATFYNDAVQPEDPYEFIGLLKGQRMLSTRRNQQMLRLAHYLRVHPNLMNRLQQALSVKTSSPNTPPGWLPPLEKEPGGVEFLREFQKLLDEYLDVSYGTERLNNQPVPVLKNLLEMAGQDRLPQTASPAAEQQKITALEQKLFVAVGPEKTRQARKVLEMGRLSWKLRDDDNLLVGRLDSQLLRAITIGIERLRSVGRLKALAPVSAKAAPLVAEALYHPKGGRVNLPKKAPQPAPSTRKDSRVKPRQLIGQPAAPGIISGNARVIRTTADLGAFRAGEILVCDAIQPNMTHLVPLAGAIIERRGGMLIHGAIIAREMGIPCVNGIPEASEILKNGILVTVDGHLGIVTIGAPEFDLEHAQN